MPSALAYLEPSDDNTGPSLRQALAANGLLAIDIATAIGEERGCLPDPQITEICAEIGPALAREDGPSLLLAVTECLVTRDVDAALEWLRVIGFLDEYLPEVTATRDLSQESGRHHKDVWEHTKLVVRQSVKRPAVRWGALLHDIGKPDTRTFAKGGVHFHGHAVVGARMFDRISRRIPFERALRRKIRFLIKQHLRASQYSRDWTDSAIRRFDRELEAHLEDLLDLSRADITSKRPGKRQALLKQITVLSTRIEEVRKADSIVPPLTAGIGNAIMVRFDLPPSRLIGDIKGALEKAIDNGELEPRQADEHYLDWLETKGIIEELRQRQAGGQRD